MAKKKAAKAIETEGAPPAVEVAPVVEATDPVADANEGEAPAIVEEPWEGERVCLIKRGEKDIVARRVTWDEYQGLGGAFAVELVSEE